MPGANYMGGKRNAAKARTRDVVGRQQKGFFGRQRLNILSKGLQTSTPKLSRDAPDPRAKEEITLAHAHSKHIPEPTSSMHKLPSTPPPGKRRRVLMEAHTSSSGASGSSRRQSKVLDALDIEEPMFLRGVLDRILAMPDLAGLPSVREAERSMPKQVVPLAPRGKKRQRTLSPSGVKYPYGLYGNRSSSCNTSVVDEALTHEQTDMGERAHIFTESVHSTSSKGKYQSSKQESVQLEFEESQQEEESDFNDSGYAELEWKKNSHDSIWSCSSSPRFFDSPPKKSSQEGRVLQASSSPRSRQAETEALVHYGSSTSEAPMSGDVGLGDWLPSVVSLKPRRTGSWPAYGCLFEQKDPWRTIGLILGLPESTPTVEEMGFAMNVNEDRDVVPEMLDRVIDGFEIEEFEDGGEELPNEPFDVQTLLEAGQVGSRNKSLIAAVELRELDGKFLGPSLFGKEVEDDGGCSEDEI
ncbi:hypothetical protein K443DRAFT_133423 [Laccaria amethystina LaAM-08-1]|uniref:Uncharacterized protein n=1 Tax=Laccaria amethystina LaAM-08-1 TaxID=1095629 RepID=A0A0C9XR94_9AGAR|nr:hypothetical protein K443DRAFT_133423 [Laccaria amethystina LaAM-08-1]